MGTTMGRCVDTASRVPHNTIGWCLPHHEGMDRQDTPDSSGCQDDTRCCINVLGKPAPLYRIMVVAEDDRRDRDGHWFASRDAMTILRQCVDMQVSGPASPHKAGVVT